MTNASSISTTGFQGIFQHLNESSCKAIGGCHKYVWPDFLSGISCELVWGELGSVVQHQLFRKPMACKQWSQHIDCLVRSCWCHPFYFNSFGMCIYNHQKRMSKEWNSKIGACVSTVSLAKPMGAAAQLENRTDWLGMNDMSSPLFQCHCRVPSARSSCEWLHSSEKHYDSLREMTAGLELADYISWWSPIRESFSPWNF